MSQASSNYNCSIYQAFNFKKDDQVLVGHLESLQIGTKTLDVDLELSPPTDFANKVMVVGAISSIYWSGGYADEIMISCNVSVDNKTNIAELVHTALSNTEVLFKFKIYEFDVVAKKYYLAFHTNDTAMKGFIKKSGGDLLLSVDTDPDPTVTNPLNYNMAISIMPKEEAQTLHIALSDTKKLTKAWGVKVT